MVHNVAPGIEPVHGYGIAPLRQRTAARDNSILLVMSVVVKLRVLAKCCEVNVSELFLCAVFRFRRKRCLDDGEGFGRKTE